MLYISTQNASAVTFANWLPLLLIHITRINRIIVGSYTSSVFMMERLLVVTVMLHDKLVQTYCRIKSLHVFFAHCYCACCSMSLYTLLLCILQHVSLHMAIVHAAVCLSTHYYCACCSMSLYTLLLWLLHCLFTNCYCASCSMSLYTLLLSMLQYVSLHITTVHAAVCLSTHCYCACS